MAVDEAHKDVYQRRNDKEVNCDIGEEEGPGSRVKTSRDVTSLC